MIGLLTLGYDKTSKRRCQVDNQHVSLAVWDRSGLKTSPTAHPRGQTGHRQPGANRVPEKCEERDFLLFIHNVNPTDSSVSC